MVNGKRGEGLTVVLRDENHTWLAGMPAKDGGQDEGPDPHELLESALAACTILTAQLYAGRKGWALTDTDCSVRVVSEGAETRIAREVRFLGELDEMQRARLLEIVNKCPIHRLLESQVVIETRADK